MRVATVVRMAVAGLALCFLALPVLSQTPAGGNFVVSGTYLNLSNMSRSGLDTAGNYGIPLPENFNVMTDLDAEIIDVGPMGYRRYRIQMGPQMTHNLEGVRITMHALAGATKSRWGDIARNRELLFSGGSAVGPVVTLGGKIESNHALGRHLTMSGLRLDVSPAYYGGRWHREVKIGCEFALNF